MSSAVYKRNVELLEADVGDELVGLDPQAGSCFGFNEVATVIWRSLEQPKSFDQLRDELLERYEVSVDECTRELQALLETMRDQGLVEAA